MTPWENIFTTWSQGPGKIEQERCDNAASMITDSIKNSDDLKGFDIEVSTQGSYRARTNIKQDSDVDICVMLKNVFFTYYPEGVTDQSVGNVGGGYSYAEFKNSLEKALIKKFGQSQVKRGNKAFDIHANSYRVNADVVPTFEYKSYVDKKDLYGNYIYHSGVKLVTDRGDSIINWPQQTYDNGVTRNNETLRKYKRCIRILKHLRNTMQEAKVSKANDIASFLVECLVWNTPVEAFSNTTYYDTIRHIIAHTCNNTRIDSTCINWGEVNELKYLFTIKQPWNRQQANSFLNAAWDFVGYK